MNLPAQVPAAYAMVFALWGASTGEWLWAALAAAALEAPRLLRRHFEIDERGFRLAWMLSLFILWGMAINTWLQTNRLEAMRDMMEWVPFALLPVMMISAWATHPGVPISSMLLILKGRYARPSMGGVKPVVPTLDPFFPCLWIVLLSISHQGPGKWFFWGCTLVMGWVFLHPAKGRQRWAFRLGMVVVAGLGFLLHTGVLRLYHFLDDALNTAAGGRDEMEASRSMTRIGSVGAIKNSSAVRWRLRPEAGPVPNYLVDATFNYFTRTQWSNNVMHLRAFRPILPPPAQDSGGDKWAVVADPEPVAQKFRLRGRPHAEWTILPLSSRVNRLCDLPATRVERNGLGVVRADSTTPVLDFEIECGLRNTLQPPPGPSDLGVPPDLEPVLRPLEQELGLHKMTPEAAAAAVSRHFQTRFQYTLDPEGASLEDFLTRTHAGHCEYFGTATTLLLRAAGIPARYQTGFSVAEFDAKTNQWIVRGTHAHAWCVAWIDGDWRIVDSTPSDWLARDSDRIPFWQNFLDWWDEKWMAFEIWRETSQASAVVGRSIPWILAAVILYTVVRFWMGRRRSAARRTGPAGPAYDPDRITSAWASVRPVVERACGPRPPALPTLAWIEAMTSWPPEVRTAAVRLVRDHYRRRFGESGRSVASDDDLADSARVVMKHAESIGPTP